MKVMVIQLMIVVLAVMMEIYMELAPGLQHVQVGQMMAKAVEH